MERIHIRPHLFDAELGVEEEPGDISEVKTKLCKLYMNEDTMVFLDPQYFSIQQSLDKGVFCIILGPL